MNFKSPASDPCAPYIDNVNHHVIDNIWDRVSITLAAYVKATYPWWSGEGDPRMMIFGPTSYRQREKPKPRLNTVIVRKATR